MNTPATANPPNTAPQNTNGLTFAQMLAIATELGTQAGQGKDVQIKFAMQVCEAAFHGQLDQQPDKHGKDKSDAVALSEAYVKAQNTAVIFDAKAPNQRKLVSNVLKCIRLGSSPKWGQGEPMQNINDLMTARQRLRSKGEKKLDDAFNTLMRYATAQLKEDQLIVGPALETYCLRKGTDPRTGEEVLRAIQKMAGNLRTGKVANCPDLDNSAEVVSIITACNKRLTAIAKAKGATAGPNV